MKRNLLLVLMIPFFLFSQEKEKNYFQNSFLTATSVLKTSFKTIPSDFVHMGKNVSEDWKKTGLYAGIVGALILVDKPVTTFYQDEIETRIDYKLPNISLRKDKFIDWFSDNDAYMTYAMLGTYAGSLFAGYEKGQYAAINGIKALGYSIIISHVMLKTIFGRSRPYYELSSETIENPHTTDNPFDFFNSRRGNYFRTGPHGTSFPSLHATAFFAMAKVFQMEFDNYWIPYGFMATVFLADIKSHRHWVSDMVAGGIIGTLIGRSVVRSSWKARGIIKEKKKAISFQFVPQISTGYNGLSVVGRF